MAMDKAKFMEVQQRAKKLIDMDRQGLLKRYENGTEMNIQENDEINFTTQEMINQPSTQSYQQPQMRNVPTNNHLPKEILESFQNTQINVDNSFGASVLDSIGVPQQNNQPVVQRKRVVTENVQQQVNNTASLSQSNNVDYSLIKTIVEDCMRKSLSSIKKSLINENTTLNENNDLALLKIGNGFKFVDKSGNIYEAKLNKIGNVHDKK